MLRCCCVVVALCYVGWLVPCVALLCIVTFFVSFRFSVLRHCVVLAALRYVVS